MAILDHKSHKIPAETHILEINFDRRIKMPPDTNTLVNSDKHPFSMTLNKPHSGLAACHSFLPHCGSNSINHGNGTG